MRTLTVTAAAVLATGALAGAGAMPAAGDSKAQTMHLVSRDIDSHSLGKHTFAGAAVDRHAGHIVGYDTFTGHFYPKQQRADIWDAIALRNGTISVVVHVDASQEVQHGRILGGTGKYKGISGTISTRAGRNPDKTFITLTYSY
jgi:hypothetical protein